MKLIRRILLPIIAVMAVGLLLAACGGSTNAGQRQESRQQAADQTQLEAAQPIPAFSRSQIRQNLIDIETAEANGVQTTSFFYNLGSNTPIKSCPSIGAPIPITDQLSNPDEQVRDPNGGGVPGSNVLAQEDPDGVYSGDGSGTYVLCINGQGKAEATYWEGYVDTEFSAAHFDKKTGQIVDTGTPTFHFSTGGVSATK